MSRARPTEYESALLTLECGRCGAVRGRWCDKDRGPDHRRRAGVGEAGGWARYLHGDRYAQARHLAEAFGWVRSNEDLYGRLDAVVKEVTTLIREVAGLESVDQATRSLIIDSLRKVRGW